MITFWQNSECRCTHFYVLKVDKDNVQMSDFVEKTLNVKFENGRGFYEFTQTMEEDLHFYKEVVVMPKVITVIVTIMK